VRLRAYRPEKLHLYRETSEEQAKIMLDKLSHFSNRLHEEFKVLTARVRPSNEILRVDPLQISAEAD